jgi:hypothetical protein
MSSICHGHLFELEGETYYRCVADCIVYRIKNANQVSVYKCQGCNRPIACNVKIKKAEARYILKKEAYLDNIGWFEVETEIDR